MCPECCQLFCCHLWQRQEPCPGAASKGGHELACVADQDVCGGTWQGQKRSGQKGQDQEKDRAEGQVQGIFQASAGGMKNERTDVHTKY